MLVAVIYTARENVSEDTTKRSLTLFTHWKPPKGYEIKCHYSFSDGSGGLGIVDVSSSAALLETAGTFSPFFDFKTLPVVEIEAAVPILQKANAWRDSVR